VAASNSGPLTEAGVVWGCLERESHRRSVLKEEEGAMGFDWAGRRTPYGNVSPKPV